jgi:diguanylate cyclase (GGDEF)-like protein/PAS domain S-box-containing protein
MNFLSMISLLNAYTFFLLGIFILKSNPGAHENRLAAVVNFCLIVWNLAYAFLYTAPTMGDAMLWHKISAFGWIFIGAFSSHFFLVLAGRGFKDGNRWIPLIYVVPVILYARTLFFPGSPVAIDFVPSRIGWGWAYVSAFRSAWFWIYSLHMLIYFPIALYSIYLWAKMGGRLRFLKQARSIIVLAVVMIILGFITDLIMPATGPVIPPFFNILSIFWGMGLYFIIKNYRLMSRYDAATPELILKTAMDPILLLDSNGVIIKCNEATMDMLNYDGRHIIGRPMKDFFDMGDKSGQIEDSLMKNKSLRNIEFSFRNSDGDLKSAVASLSVMENRMDAFVGVVVCIHDITEHILLSRSLEKMANYDKLTSLPNRRLFFSTLEKAIENYSRSSRNFALIYIDLDGFKVINDSYGHEIGDLLLVKIAEAFTHSIRKHDMIARIGGDEFILLATDLTDESELDIITRRMRDIFARPFVVRNHLCHVGISMGISRSFESPMTPDELIRTADKRMYREKQRKRGSKILS